MNVLMLVTVIFVYILLENGDVSNNNYRATYCRFVLILVTVTLGLHTACMS